MSDLGRVVEEELTAYHPAAIPPLEDVLAGSRNRRRRRAAGVAALSVAAVLVVGAGPALLASKERDAPVASPAVEGSASFIASCTGGLSEPPDLVTRPDLVGQPESALADLGPDTDVRILGRDGVCASAVTSDLSRRRVNVLITDGVVMWAAAF